MRHTVKLLKLCAFTIFCTLVLLLVKNASFLAQYARNFLESKHSTETQKVTTQYHLIRRPSRQGNVLRDMAMRRNQVHSVCREQKEKSSTLSLPRALVSVPRAAVFCPVEKTASTFFRRLMYQLDHTDPVRPPFEVPVKMIYACPSIFTSIENYAKQLKQQQKVWERKQERIKNKMKKKKLQKEKPPTIEDFLQSSTNFLFVRDPYSRLFSAYVDKLLAPNPVYWQEWGVVATKNHRTNPTELSLKCGHDVTFKEFISFVLDYTERVESMDPHLRPIFNLCKPCDVNYTVIGHMKTFERDAVYLAKLLNVSEAQLEFDKMAADSVKDALEDSVMDAFTDWLDRLTKCITKFEIMQRIWRKLQIRGLLSVTVKFSDYLNETTGENVDVKGFATILGKALRLSTNKELIQKQKELAFEEAYNTLSLNQMTHLAQMYDLDFKTFHFNSQPKLIFEKSSELFSVNLLNALDSSKDWRLGH